tara:strand:- start:21883 stop:24930 length:3048 start_codon:yes stop_codon:yes gene_type:complete
MKNIFHIIIISAGLVFSQTTEQINKAKEVIQRTGLSESQARDAAKARGYTDKQIDTALRKEKALKAESGESVPDFTEKVGLPELGKSNKVVQEQPVLDTMEPIVGEELPIIVEDDLGIVDESGLIMESKTLPARRGLNYFGYDIFTRDPSLFQATSVGAVDPDYLIGPGDEIIVMLWGETQFREVLQVDREGFVFVAEIGQVFVNGLNLNLLESKLFRVFSQSYASLNPQGRTPTTFLDVSLGNLRPLRIQVLGEVAQPGAYTVSPSATLFSALYYFNGPTTQGSLRDIQLIRGGKKIASIDFYDYLLTGKTPKDQKLQLDDVIFISRRLKTVTIEGEINRSGIYELKPQESLADLINIAGDLKITAYLDRAQIDRIVPFEERAQLGMDRMYTDVNLKQILKSDDGFLLQDGDRIQIFSILDLRQNVVAIQGAVTRPGSYDLGDSLKLSELIKKADGLLGDAYLDRVDIVRIKPDFTEELIKLNLGQAINENLDNDINLQGLDRVRVYGMTEMVPKTYVSISGHVKRPGRFLLQENMTLYDLIFKAGGFLDEEYKKLTYLQRAELVRFKKDSDDKEIIPFNLRKVLDEEGMANTLLITDDAIRIYSAAEIEGEVRYVSVSGHVKRPGRYELYEENMRIYDILFKAGGFDDPLFKSQTFLKRADLIRFDSDRITQFIIPFNLDSVLSDKSNKQNIILLPGDEIRVFSEAMFNTVKSVSINGIVRIPGTYTLKRDMNLTDLILEAGGLDDNVYRYRVEVARIDPLNNKMQEYAKVITFDIDERFSLSSSTYNEDSKKGLLTTYDDFKLNAFDLVWVRPDPFFTNQKQVSITGEVLYPGQYTILSSNEKITDIIQRAGGLRPNAYSYGSTFSRDGKRVQLNLQKIIKNPKSKLNVEVVGNDEIDIAIRPNIIEVLGEVSVPGFYKFQPRKRISDIIKTSGGFSQNAEKDDVHIRYPDGTSYKYHRWFNNKKVLDGSVITVGMKKEEEPFNHTEYAKELTAIIANLAQAITVLILARQN